MACKHRYDDVIWQRIENNRITVEVRACSKCGRRRAEHTPGDEDAAESARIWMEPTRKTFA